MFVYESESAFIKDGGIIIEVFLWKPNSVAIKLEAGEITNGAVESLARGVARVNSSVSNKS